MDRTAELGVMTGMIVPIAMFAMIFGIVHLHKRERMAMIERGMDPRIYKQKRAPYNTLKAGLLLIGAGVGLFLAFLLDRTTFKHAGDDFDNANVAIYFAMIAIFGGAGLFVSFLMEMKGDKEDDKKVE